MKIIGRFYVSELSGGPYAHDGMVHGFVEGIGCRCPMAFNGFQGLDLFIHRETEGSGWCVSEGKTGLRIGQGVSIMDACIAAEEFLKQFGLQTFMDRIEAAIKITGLSPRYAGAGEPAVAAAPHPPSENTSSAEIMGDS